MKNNLKQETRNLSSNVTTLIEMYSLGLFEHRVMWNAAGFLDKVSPTDGRFGKAVSLTKAAEKILLQVKEILPQLSDLKEYANNELYADGEKLWPGLSGFENLVKLLYRAQVVFYELHDYFLCVSTEIGRTYCQYADEIVREPQKAIARIFKKDTTGMVWDKHLAFSATDEFLLLALCGINAYYRQHSSETYEHGLQLVGHLERYLKESRFSDKGRESLGLLGLSSYLKGRLAFGLSYYSMAREAWITSSECYIKKIEQKQTSLLNGSISQEKFDSLRLLALRRSALATALGNGYLSLVLGDVNDALKAVVISRGVLTMDCAAIYLAYVDLIYAAAKCAKYSSDPGELAACEKLLSNALQIFEQQVPGTRYVHRANLELAVVYHYQAKGLIALRKGGVYNSSQVRMSQELYRKAFECVVAAIEFAATKESGKERNPRMLAEAYILRSHLWRHQATPDYEKALQDSLEAAKYTGKISQLKCEAMIALGAVFLSIAEDSQTGKLSDESFCRLVDEQLPRLAISSGTLNTRERLAFCKQRAGELFCQALEEDGGTNARIRAVCYLRLCRLSLLTPTTYPDARFYFQKYQEVESKVEHAYCKEQATLLWQKLSTIGNFFFVDVRETWNVKEWQTRVKDYLLSELTNRLAEKLQGVLPSQDKGSLRIEKNTSEMGLKLSRNQRRKETDLSLLAKAIEENLDVSHQTAFTLAKARKQELINKCKAVRKRLSNGNVECPANAIDL